MKKFYEAPVVELTGFSAEDVITTSAVVAPINTASMTVAEKEAFVDAVSSSYTRVNEYGSSSYSW